jgi:hypothetical protein
MDMQYTTREKRLDIKRFTSEILLTDESLISLPNTTVLHTLTDFAAHHRLSITSKMAGEVVETHKYPTTWWDAVKARFFPQWLLRRLPVQWTVVKTWQCYPEYPLPDSWGRPIQLIVTERTE